MIKVEELGLAFNGEPVLHNVSLCASEGSVLAVLGPNGVGKTTLLRCISGLLVPQHGQIHISGREVSSFSRNEIARIMAIVPQQHKPAFPYTVAAFVLTGRTPYIGRFSMPCAADKAVVSDCLESVGISHLKSRQYTHISGGEMRLVLIARALAQQPRILLLDEPTVHLDLKNRTSVLTLVRKLTDSRKITTVVSLHDPNDVLAFADKVVLLSEGRTVAEGNPQAVITPSLIKEVYGVDVEVISHRGRQFVVPLLNGQRNKETS